MSHYTHLTIEEREQSRSLREKGASMRAIALMLGRSPSTISREFKRNSYSDGKYAAFHAQKKYTKKKQIVVKLHYLKLIKYLETMSLISLNLNGHLSKYVVEPN